MTDMMNAFLFVLSGGYGRILPDALWLAQRFLTLELVMLFLYMAFGRGDGIGGLLFKVLSLLAIIWFLRVWPEVSLAFLEMMVHAGIQIGGGTLTVRDFLNPSAVMQHGMETIGVVFTSLTTAMGFSGVMRLPELFILGLASFGIWLCYFVLAAQVFVRVLIFYLSSAVVVFLLPFGVWRPTAFMAEKAFALVIGTGISLAVLAVVTSMTLPFLVTMKFKGDPNLWQAFNLMSISGLMGILAWKAPEVAAGIMSGAPSLSATTLAHGAVSMAATVGTAGAAGSSLARAAVGMTQQAVKAGAAVGTAARLGGLRGLGNLASSAASQAGNAAFGGFRMAASQGAQFARGGMTFTPGASGGGAPGGWARGWRPSRMVPPEERPQGHTEFRL